MSSDSSSSTKKSLLEKILTPGWKPSLATFPELPECIIWIRFILALCFGLYIGLQPVSRGGVNILFALNLVAFVPIFYATTYLGANQEEFGSKLLLGGVVQGLALVILIWIYFYTGYHPEDEAAFASVYSKFMEASASTEDVATDGNIDPIVAEESEF